MAGATYFLTFCATGNDVLAEGGSLGSIFVELGRMEADGIWKVRCVTVMPDHVHLIVELGNKLVLGRAVARLKAKTKVAILARNMRWDVGFFDHRVSPDEGVFSVFSYVFSNPVKAGLISVDGASTWRGWWISPQDAEWFYPEAELVAWADECPIWANGMR